MQEASSPKEEEGLEEVCLINTLVEEHCDKNLEESLNESLEVFEEGLPEPSDVLAIMSPWRRREEILPLFNKEDSQGAAMEDPPKLVLKPLPVDLKCKTSEAAPEEVEPHIQEVVRGEVLKLLQAGSYIPFQKLVGEPTQVVPKKSGITVIQNEKGEEVSTRPTSGWRVCIDYRRLNSVTRKTISHCLSWTKSLRESQDILSTVFWMMYAEHFSDMVERIMEVFMDDITVYGSSYEECLLHLEAVLQRYKAKVELIVKLPPPTNVKGIRQFLGHDAKFVWDEKCQKSFEELKQFLTTAPIVRAPNWKLPFEAQRNYTTTEKELLAVVFALDKFRTYLVGSSIVVFTDHSALKYLLTKQDTKARLIRWILLLQEFNLQIRDKKGVENVVAPWYSHIANFLVTGEVQVSGVPKTRGISLLRSMPIIGRSLFSSNIVRIKHKKCVPEQEQSGILSHCHDSACGGMPTLCARDVIGVKGLVANTPKYDALEPHLDSDVFDVWGIDFMGPFPMSFGHSYILVGVDYVSKWVEAIPCRSNDHKVVLKFLKDNIFARFGVPKAIISDGGTHF
ncbi:Retrovirus-related Pol polyprotein from transposon 17.6 [Vitis vinifera]|uniref:Retrovirus-related Pol polyprotein from transposon 17.6 n=1 Tax=Vitis vinifera TaxID=29760 RepID=A0A438G8K4_VITVI|nr:Retrovirus-related Pol polyprotein from transposon 17.6 [Vitis vinifera]